MDNLEDWDDGKMKLINLVEQLRHHEHGELEARFGTVENGRFKAGVTVNFFKKCLSMCESFKEWSSVSDWAIRKDFFFSNSTRVSMYTENQELKTIAVQKKKIKSITNKIENNLTFDKSNVFPSGLRLSLSTENPTDYSENETPKLIRFKYTKQFFTLSGWSFDFSKTFTSDDFQNVMDSCACLERFGNEENQDFTYEIEIELQKKTYLSLHSNEHISNSLIMKIFDFLLPIHKIKLLH
ncbi:MAG: hypothetical protein CMO44_13225 [Verrucomicrobiales bacterium]|nr:hypothetical protein [Verrucomicrobiales bacterium]|tara:strand:+ start:6444 stop:7160 length:717 start_codon:yes stop_codon:yes gene_type:complete